MGMRGERGVVHMRMVHAVILPDHFKLASYGNGIFLQGSGGCIQKWRKVGRVTLLATSDYCMLVNEWVWSWYCSIIFMLRMLAMSNLHSFLMHTACNIRHVARIFRQKGSYIDV